jgi:hypothetical protein
MVAGKIPRFPRRHGLAPLASTQISVREADGRIKPRVERNARNPGIGGGEDPTSPRSGRQKVRFSSMRRHLAANDCRPLRGLDGAFAHLPRVAALPRSTLGFMLSPAPQAENQDSK